MFAGQLEPSSAAFTSSLEEAGVLQGTFQHGAENHLAEELQSPGQRKWAELPQQLPEV